MKSIFSRIRGHKRLVIILAIVIIGGYFVTRSQNGNGALDQASITRGTVEEEIVLTGEISATDYATLQFNTSGTISWVGVSVGENVKKGQALLKLDTLKLNAAYQIAVANYRAAQANAEEVLDDVKGNDDDETFEEKNTRTAAEATRDKAYDALVAAQKELQDATLIAPFSGVVAILNSESAGVNVTAGTPQVILVNPATMYFEVSADQTEVSRFMIDDKAEITLDAFDNETLTGTISSISVAPDATESGTVYPIRLSLELNGASKYKIGMTGDARFIVTKKEGVLYIPSDYVNSDKDGEYVRIDGGKNKKYIEVGIEGGDKTEISGDISEGEQVFD